MKFLLVALNAKYIHSNPALYSLRAYAGELQEHVEIAEYTINNSFSDVLAEVYKRKPDAIGFSCYIWNVEMVLSLTRELRKLLPQVPVWLGGPEVSYRAEELLMELPEVRGVLVGEGEETFARLVALYKEAERRTDRTIPGLVFRDDNGAIFSTEQAKPLDFSCLPFPYGDENLSFFDNRIIYYESSRGCP